MDLDYKSLFFELLEANETVIEHEGTDRLREVFIGTLGKMGVRAYLDRYTGLDYDKEALEKLKYQRGN